MGEYKLKIEKKMNKTLNILTIIAEKNLKNKDYINKNLYRLLYKTDLYIIAYEKLKSNPGNMTPGSDKQTLDGISLKIINNTINSLRNENIKISPAPQRAPPMGNNFIIGRIEIPKKYANTPYLVRPGINLSKAEVPYLVRPGINPPGPKARMVLNKKVPASSPNGQATQELRPIDIGNPRDKLLLEVIRMILEAIYEPLFLENSHGFRPNKSCHTALKDIKINFTGNNWFIEGDINCFFNSIAPAGSPDGQATQGLDHNILINLLKKKIEDVRFLNLIRKILKAGYIIVKTHKIDLIGIPQGNIISPSPCVACPSGEPAGAILSNIYLHELDKYVEILKINFSCEDYRYFSLRDKKSSKGFISHAEVSPADFTDGRAPQRLRLNYVRYADDWVIGLIGTKKEAEIIKKKIKKYLKNILNLKLNVEKTKITNSSKEKILFLGTNISCSLTEAPAWLAPRVSPLGYRDILLRRSLSFAEARLNPNGGLQKNTGTGIIILEIPVNIIIKKLSIAFFCNKNGKPLPKFQWYGKSHNEIIKAYNSVIRGIANYYSFIDNLTMLRRINYILLSSAAKLLAAKFKLQTQAKVYKKFGKYLISPDKTKIIKVSALFRPNSTIGRTCWDIYSQSNTNDIKIPMHGSNINPSPCGAYPSGEPAGANCWGVNYKKNIPADGFHTHTHTHIVPQEVKLNLKKNIYMKILTNSHNNFKKS